MVSFFGNNFTVEILNTLTQAQLHKHMSLSHTEWNLLVLPPKPCWASNAKTFLTFFFFLSWQQHRICGLMYATVPFTAVPKLFWHQWLVLWKTIFHFSMDRDGEDCWACIVSHKERQMKLCLHTRRLLPTVPNRLWTSTGPRPGDWGPLL